MTKLTLQEQFVAALGAMGEAEVRTKSTKYFVYTRKEGGYFYIGKNGSLRFGATKASSIPSSKQFKQQLLACNHD